MVLTILARAGGPTASVDMELAEGRKATENVLENAQRDSVGSEVDTSVMDEWKDIGIGLEILQERRQVGLFEVVAAKDDRPYNITKVFIDATQIPFIVARKKFDEADVKLRRESGQRWLYRHEGVARGERVGSKGHGLLDKKVARGMSRGVQMQRQRSWVIHCCPCFMRLTLTSSHRNK